MLKGYLFVLAVLALIGGWAFLRRLRRYKISLPYGPHAGQGRDGELSLIGEVVDVARSPGPDLPGYSPYGDDYSPSTAYSYRIVCEGRVYWYVYYRTYFQSPYSDAWHPNGVGARIRVHFRKGRAFFQDRWIPVKFTDL